MNNPLRLLLGFILSLYLMGVRQTHADTLVLMGGRTITGAILQTNGGNILVLTDYGALNYSQAIIRDIKAVAENATSLNTNRIPEARSLIQFLGRQPWATNLQQIPATVIAKGILRNVPYTSFRCGTDYEVNIYGDLDHPAGIEVGVYRTLLENNTAKSNCLEFISAQLGEAADRKFVQELNLEKDLKVRNGMTFEITPPTAEDAYLGWWVSVYSEAQLDRARASDEELKRISVNKKEAAKEAQLSKDATKWSDAELNLARPDRPDTITFKSKYGNIIENAEIVRVNDGVSLVWRKGISGGLVKLADLPEELRIRYGYDPNKSALADAEERQQQARNLQQAQNQAIQVAQPAAAQIDVTSYSGDTSSYSSSSYRSAPSSSGSVYVRSYIRKDGTYVHSHTRSAPRRR